ncbi:MAG: tRNA (adenosine(37)-N6)-threonylcarbamoyltransferase complex ATPase subunit type 1 TsaE [Rhodobacterales bacterium 12-64-8]|nr:MAG: tRNA (adenosine(37)-N6)-threonylcarbamoyltransferase complex ATPase subunit type 1 TsaE [Rhodobacterales bacterium 12-64-8]
MPHPTLTLALPDEAATAALGERLGAVARAGDVIALVGDLGAGKTTLARALIRSHLGPETEAPSPTFTLVQTYPGPRFDIWHFDLYRLEDPGEARELGMEEAVDGLSLIEWPERLGRYLPTVRLEVRLSLEGQGRIARLVDLDDWSTRLDGDWRPNT